MTWGGHLLTPKALSSTLQTLECSPNTGPDLAWLRATQQPKMSLIKTGLFIKLSILPLIGRVTGLMDLKGPFQ